MKLKTLSKMLTDRSSTVASCTKWMRKNYSTIQLSLLTFIKTDAELASAVGACLFPLYGFGGNNHMIPLNEVTTDEMVVPTRGADWGDGGHWVRLQTHTYTKTDPTQITDGFLFLRNSTCNKLLLILATSTSTKAPAYIAELKALRAIYY